MGKLKHLYMDHRGRMPDDDGWRWNMTEACALGYPHPCNFPKEAVK